MPDNLIPAGCPRVGVSSAPVRCALTECRYHCGGTAGTPGPVSQRVRLRLVGDDCALSIATRVYKIGISQNATSRLLGISKRSVQKTEKRAWRKLLAKVKKTAR